MKQNLHQNLFDKSERDTKINNKKTRNVLHQLLRCAEGYNQDIIYCYNHRLMNMLSCSSKMKTEIRKFEKK